MDKEKVILKIINQEESIEEYIKNINTVDILLLNFFLVLCAIGCIPLFFIIKYNSYVDILIFYILFSIPIFSLFFKKNKRKNKVLKYMDKEEYKRLSKQESNSFYISYLMSQLTIEELNTNFEKIVDNIKSEDLRNNMIKDLLNDLKNKDLLNIEFESFLKSKYIGYILKEYCLFLDLNIINEFLKIEDKIENNIEKMTFLNLKYDIVINNLSDYLNRKEFDNLENIIKYLNDVNYNDKYVYLLKEQLKLKSNYQNSNFLNELNTKLVDNF